MRSAAVIFSSTYLRAESTARCTSSGCIELTSKTSVISRRPASMSDVIGAGAGSGAAPTAAAAGARFASSAILASTPARRPADSTGGTRFVAHDDVDGDEIQSGAEDLARLRVPLGVRQD